VSLSCCGVLHHWPCFMAFPCRSPGKVRSFDTGPGPRYSSFLKSQKPGKGDALRKEKGVFAYFCRRMDKSMASGGTRPAGFAFFEIERTSKQDNRLTIYCPVYDAFWRNLVSSLKCRHKLVGPSVVSVKKLSNQRLHDLPRACLVANCSQVVIRRRRAIDKDQAGP